MTLSPKKCVSITYYEAFVWINENKVLGKLFGSLNAICIVYDSQGNKLMIHIQTIHYWGHLFICDQVFNVIVVEV
jgi:hypothetical protein